VGQLLEFLVGRSFDRLVDEGDPDTVLSEKEIFARVGDRPDVIAARESLETFRQNLTVARSAFFPTVTLSGDAYTKRLDGFEGNSWDATLAVNVPLFNGLSDWGQVKQARAQEAEAELRFSLAKRQAILEALNAYSRWQSNGRRVAALDKAFTASEKNYRLQLEDFERNLVNNLDVLQALQDLQGVRRDLVAAKADARRSYWSLKVASGDIEQ
jgi:outer membrane protein TolC